MPGTELNIVILLFPRVTQLDLTAPAQVFAKYPDTRVHLAWHTLDPVPTDCGWSIVPTTTLAACPEADVVFVPGGQGAFDLFDDPAALAFLAQQSATARWVSSVCTGSFALAAAGALDGYRATSHWASLSMLAEFGVHPVSERVVIDSNRITGAGITSGLDFALVLATQLFGEAHARRIQLGLEYDPQPPFDAGTPATAAPDLVAELMSEVQARRLPGVRQAAHALKNGNNPSAPMR